MAARRTPGLIASIAVVLLCAVLLEFGGNLLLQRLEHRELPSDGEIRRIALQLTESERIAIATPRRERARLIRARSGEGLALNWVSGTVITDFSVASPPLAAMRARLVRESPGLAGDRLRLSLLPSQQAGRRDLLGTLALRDGSFVTFRVSPYLEAPPSPVAIMLLHVLLMVLVMGAALLAVATLLRPLRDLAAAADATGRGEVRHIMPTGPDEVRRVAVAFAAMQDRLVRMMEAHSEALIAVSHDLRTPIQRMRLRTATLDDPEAHGSIAQDLAEMERFIDSALAYVRSGQDEPERLIDLAALLTTIVDDASDLGVDAAYAGPETLLFVTRPVAFRRMLDNLVENARQHADRIHVTLTPMPGERIRITVEDDGPGIAPPMRAEALLPFRRLDASRANTGGAGLGLPASLRTARALGGELILGEAGLGGLRAEITLPRRKMASRPEDPVAEVQTAT